MYQREDFRTASIGHHVGERGLLDRQERSDLVAARTDDANRSRQQENPEIRGRCERQPRGRHEQRAGEKHSPAPDSVRSSRDRQGDDGVTDQRQREQHTHLLFAEAEGYQVEHEHDRQRPVREQPDEPRCKEQPGVAGQVREDDAHRRRSLHSSDRLFQQARRRAKPDRARDLSRSIELEHVRVSAVVTGSRTGEPPGTSRWRGSRGSPAGTLEWHRPASRRSAPRAC